MNTDFNHSVFFWTWACMSGCTLFMMYCSYREGTFSVQQMRELGRVVGFKRFLPFLAHGGVLYGDFFVVAPIIAFINAKYGDQWSLYEIWKPPLMTAWIITGLLHVWWAKDPLPGCLVYEKDLTTAGRIHFYYMGFALSVIVLFYFHTQRIVPAHLYLISILLGIHVAIGHHMVLSWIKPDWWPYNTLKDWKAWTVTIGCWIGLFIRCRQILKGN